MDVSLATEAEQRAAGRPAHPCSHPPSLTQASARRPLPQREAMLTTPSQIAPCHHTSDAPPAGVFFTAHVIPYLTGSSVVTLYLHTRVEARRTGALFCSLMSAQRLTLRLAHNRPPGFVLGEAGGRWHRALQAAGRAVGLFHTLGLSHWREASKVLLNQLCALTSPTPLGCCRGVVCRGRRRNRGAREEWG